MKEFGMGRTWKDNAAEFAALDQGEGWPFAILVACSVAKGGKEGVSIETPEGKVSARAFAEAAGTSPKRVLLYLTAWEKAAADGVVPEAAKLSPEVAHKVRVPDAQFGGKNGYYDGSAQGGGLPADRIQAVKASTLVEKMTPEQRVEVATEILQQEQTLADVVVQAIETAPTASHVASRAQAALDRRSLEDVNDRVRNAGGNPDMPPEPIGDEIGVKLRHLEAQVHALLGDAERILLRAEPDQQEAYRAIFERSLQRATTLVYGRVPDTLEGVER